MLVGGPVFWFIIWCPIAPGQDPVHDICSQTFWDRVRWGTWVGAFLFVVSGLLDALRAAAQVFPVTELDLVWMFLTSSRYGQVSLAKVFIAPVFASLALYGTFSAKSRAGEAGGLIRNLLLLVTGVGMLLTISTASHAAARPGVGPMIVDLVHLMAAVVWGGGLIYFSAFPWKAFGPVSSSSMPSRVAPLAKRFSLIALFAVIAVVLTGAFSSYFHIHSPDAMVTTAYGRTLLVKLVLFFLIIGVAAINLMYFIPRLSSGRPIQLLRAFFATVRIEAVFVVTLLIVTAHLTTLPPADVPSHVDEVSWEGIKRSGKPFN